MSQKAAEYAEQVVTWWAEHKNDSGDVFKQLDLCKTAISEMLSAISFLIEDIHNLEGRPPEALGRRIWTVGGMKMRGDLTRFG